MPRPASRFAGLWGAVIGAVLGFGVGALIYWLITPLLENSPGLIREMQGFAWNLVPGLSILGAIIGLVLGLARRRRAQRRASAVEPPAE